jgi:hypothetical protein
MAHDWRAFLIPLLMVSMLPALADAPPKSASDPVVRASAAFLALEAGKIDRTTLTPSLNTDLTDAAIAAMAARLAPYGVPETFPSGAKTDVDGVTTYVFRLKWTNGSIDYVCGFDDASQKIAKLYFLPGPGA